MNKMPPPGACIGRINRHTVIGFALMIAVNAQAQQAGFKQPLDCLLEPYEVVEVSSAVEGVIESIHVDRNDEVQKGQLLVELDSDVERAQVDLATARAGMDSNVDLRATEVAFSERNLSRLEELYNNDTVSLHVKDQAETDAKKSRMQLKNAKDAQRLAELELAKAEAILSLRTMRSPIDGVVVARNKVAGEFVEDQSILRLAQLDPLKVEVIVPVERFGSIQRGMKVEVTPEHYGDVPHRATVILVDRVIDPASGTFDVRAELPNPGHKIPSGLRCSVTFLDEPPDTNYVAFRDRKKQERAIAQRADAASGEESIASANYGVVPVERAPAAAMVANVAQAAGSVPTAETSPAQEPALESDIESEASALTSLLASARDNSSTEEAAVSSEESPVEEVSADEELVADFSSADEDGEVDVTAVAAISVPVSKAQDSILPEQTQVGLDHCAADGTSTVYSYALVADPDANDSKPEELANELRESGVKDLYIHRSGAKAGTIALGVFRQKVNADHRLEELRKLGFAVDMDVRTQVKPDPACSNRRQVASSQLGLG